MIRHLLLYVVFSLITLCGICQGSGYRIEIKLNNFTGSEVFLAYYYGDKTYIKDTAYKINNSFIFSGSDKLPAGHYLICTPPADIQLNALVDDNDQHFTIEADYPVVPKDIKFTGSPKNQLFQNYINMVSNKKAEADVLDKQLNDQAITAAQKEQLKLKREKLDAAVITAKKEIIQAQTGSLLSAILKASIDLTIPTFKGTKEEQDEQSFYWYRSHYFDNIKLSDPRLLRTDVLHQKISGYIEKMTQQDADSIIIAIDKVLAMVKPSAETYKFYLTYFLNKYAKSNILAFDAIYVHLALKYYEKGEASWIEKDQLEKIISNAKRLAPLLIGKKAPDLLMETLSGDKQRLYDFNADITVLFFWDTKSSRCRKSAPFIAKVAKVYKSRGVKVFSICSKTDGLDKEAAIKECGEKISEYNFEGLFNTIAPDLTSTYKTLYDIQAMPQIYILDKNKMILCKKIVAEQIEEVLDDLLK